MKTRKEVKEYLDELKEQYSEWEELSGAEQDIDAEEGQIIEIQIETLEWVLK